MPKNEIESNNLAQMHSPLFFAASSFESLWSGWQKVQANRGSGGGDGVGQRQFGKNAHARVAQLGDALRDGSYHPGPVRSVYIPKKNGDLRRLDIPCIVDRVAQSSVAQALTPLFEKEFEPTSFAYRKGRGVAQAIARVAVNRRHGYRHVVEADIEDYFGSIPHAPLIDLLDATVGEDRLVDLIALWLEGLAPEGRGVGQGSPLSPMLANLYLDSLDEAMEASGVRIVRFADDFILMCKKPERAEAALEEAKALLASKGLKLNVDKTGLTTFEKGFRFLGHVLVRSMVWREVYGESDDTGDVVADTERMLAAAEGLHIEEEDEAEQRDVIEGEKGARGRWLNPWQVLYAVSPGHTLCMQGRHFQIRKGDVTLLDLPPSQIDRIEVGPDVQIDTQVLDAVAAEDIVLARVNGWGETLGVWQAPDHHMAQRHLAQAAFTLNPELRLSLARGFLAGKVFNQRSLLKRLNRTRKLQELAPSLVRLGRLVRIIEKKPMQSIEQLMGYEGEAAALYWAQLRTLLDLPWAFYGPRKRRVGFDAFNLTIDCLSSMLLRDCRMAIERAGLHPGFGIVHATNNGRESLPLDLAEEFRSPIVEACAVSMFRQGVLRESHFKQFNVGQRLEKNGWETIIRHYEAWVQKVVTHPSTGEKMMWRAVINHQAQSLIDVFEQNGTYMPYQLDF
jgi:CRISPR-associated protein Cas1